MKQAILMLVDQIIGGHGVRKAKRKFRLRALRHEHATRPTRGRLHACHRREAQHHLSAELQAGVQHARGMLLRATAH